MSIDNVSNYRLCETMITILELEDDVKTVKELKKVIHNEIKKRQAEYEGGVKNA